MRPSSSVSMPVRSTVPAGEVAGHPARAEVDDGDVVVLLERDDGPVVLVDVDDDVLVALVLDDDGGVAAVGGDLDRVGLSRQGEGLHHRVAADVDHGQVAGRRREVVGGVDQHQGVPAGHGHRGGAAVDRHRAAGLGVRRVGDVHEADPALDGVGGDQRLAVGGDVGDLGDRLLDGVGVVLRLCAIVPPFGRRLCPRTVGSQPVVPERHRTGARRSGEQLAFHVASGHGAPARSDPEPARPVLRADRRR
jgi:hypothetical protein